MQLIMVCVRLRRYYIDQSQTDTEQFKSFALSDFFALSGIAPTVLV